MVWNRCKTFSTTRHEHRRRLGEVVTEWMKNNKQCEVVDAVVRQSSDNEFHCLSIILFIKE